MNAKKLTRTCIDKIPPYIPGKPIEEVERELGLNGVVKMASNENPLGPSNEVRLTMLQALERVAYYPDANTHYLKEALAGELGVETSNLIIGNGSDDVNRMVAETFFKPTDEIVIPQPTFSMYEIVSLLMGAKPVFVKAACGLGNDLNAMLEEVTSHTKAVFICNPNNPTGTIVKRSELLAFLDNLPPKILVIIDEAYSDYVDDPEFSNGISLLKEGRDNLIVYRTFSKIHALAGIRLGYAVADSSIIEQVLRVKDPFNVNLVAQAAGIAALNSKKHMMLSKELVQMGRRQFYEELKELNVDFIPTQANFILIDCKRDTQEIYQFLLQNGVIVRTTHSFGLPNYIRVTFGTAEQNNRFFKIFKDGLKKIS